MLYRWVTHIHKKTLVSKQGDIGRAYDRYETEYTLEPRWKHSKVSTTYLLNNLIPSHQILRQPQNLTGKVGISPRRDMAHNPHSAMCGGGSSNRSLVKTCPKNTDIHKHTLTNTNKQKETKIGNQAPLPGLLSCSQLLSHELKLVGWVAGWAG